jgi:hypothetical protein
MKKLALLTAVMAAGALASAGTASAATRYASPTGSGPVANCLSSAPCSLTDAVKSPYAVNADTVILLPGIYSVGTQLFITTLLNIHGTGSPSATKIVSTFTTDYPVYLDSDGAVISDLELSGAATSNATMLVHSGTLRRVIVRSSTSAACAGVDGTIVDSICQSATQNGLAMNTLFTGEEMTLRNDTMIGGPSGFGISISSYSGQTADINLSNVIATGGSGGIRLSSDGTGAHSIFTADHSNYRSVVLSGSGNRSGTAAGSGTNQTALPIFTNAAAGDFSEAAGSPTIDAGVVDELSGDLDLIGLARTVGAAPDIGAYEYVPPPPPPPPPSSAAAKDTTAPKITVSKKPKSKTTSKKLKVVFKADETATFKCKLDKGKFKTCKSPYKKTVKLGKHKLKINATDAAGNVSATKSISWTVKKKT